MKKSLYLIFTILLLSIIAGALYLHLERHKLRYKYFSEINTAIDSFPNPPKPGSEAASYDEEMYKKGLMLRKSVRVKEAQAHARIYKLDRLEEFFSNFLGKNISRDSTPKTQALLEEIYYISGRVTGKVKKKYNRPRPFAVHTEDATCLPDSKSSHNFYGSYPSFHAATAWSIGLTLAKIIPEKSTAILEQTQHLGDSRWICGYHWISDVDASRTMVTNIMENLMKNSDFQHRVTEAQKEWLSVPKK